MKRQKHSLGSVLVVGLALIAGLVLFGGAFRLLLAAGLAFVVWKVLFDRTPAVTTSDPVAIPPLPELPEPVAPDEELRRLDAELEQAIRAANAAREQGAGVREG